MFQEGNKYKAKVLNDITGEIVDLGEFDTLTEALNVFHKKRQELREQRMNEGEEDQASASTSVKESETENVQMKDEMETEQSSNAVEDKEMP